MRAPTMWTPIFLAIAGMIAALCNFLIPNLPTASELAYGFVFGVTLTGYFVVVTAARNLAKIATFLSACTLLIPIGVASAVGALNIAHWLSFDSPYLQVLFISGFICTLVLLTAGVASFDNGQLGGGVFAKCLAWSTVGGILCICGNAINTLTTGSSALGNLRPLLLVWQPGVALLLGILLFRRRNVFAPVVDQVDSESGSFANRGFSVSKTMLLAALLSVIGFFVSRSLQISKENTRVSIAAQRYAANAPSESNLKPLPRLAMEQALIIQEIAGLYPWGQQFEQVRRLGTSYSVGYTTRKDPSSNMIERQVYVEVDQLPNNRWAEYLAENPQNNVLVFSPASLTPVTKRGQVVTQNTYMRIAADGGFSPCFSWPSANFFVAVCYQTPKVDEQFLSLYLEKYPSSLPIH